jgi:hypothetical protein
MTPTIVRSGNVTSRADDGRRARSEVVVARRYLEHGFLDAALRIFARQAARVTADDWNGLARRLLERGRILDAVSACQMGEVPLPRQELLAIGDRQLDKRDVDGATRYYELAKADHARWSKLVDVLTRLPGRELLAVEVSERHLLPPDRPLALVASA